MKVILGQRIPDVNVGHLDEAGLPVSISLRGILDQGTHIVIGVPGAFTPICTKRHLPRFIEKAPALKQSGFDQISCIVSNDPFAVDQWRRQIDPEGRLQFYADGPMAFSRWFGLTETLPDHLHIGERSKRYLLIVRNGVVQRVNIERTVIEFTCTGPEDLDADSLAF